MRDRDKITIDDFLTGPMLAGFSIGFLGFLLVGISIATTFGNTDEVNMRKVLYSEISGNTGPESTVDDQKVLSASKYFAWHLKAEAKNGVSIQEIVKKTESYYQIFGNALSEKADTIQNALTSRFPQDIGAIVMGRNKTWHEVVKNMQDQNALAALLRGDTKNKDLLRVELNLISNLLEKNFLFFLVVLSQMGAVWGFMFYLVDMHSYDDKRWFHLPWNKLGTYVFILFLLPGALIPVFFAALIILLQTDLSETYKKIKEKKRAKKLAKEKEIDLKFRGLPVSLAGSRKDSEALLEKLESKLHKEKAGV